MALHASAKHENLRASIEKYLVDTFQGTNGLDHSTTPDVAAANWQWPGMKHDTAALSYFVRPTLEILESPYFRAADNGDPGYWRLFLLVVEVFFKRPSINTRPFYVERAIDFFVNGFRTGTGITIKDYAGSSATLGKAFVRDRQPIKVNPEDLWLRGRLDVTLEWLERDTTA